MMKTDKPLNAARSSRKGRKSAVMPQPGPAVIKTRNGYVCCRVCSCTTFEPCNPPCCWVRGKDAGYGGDLCSTCHMTAVTHAQWEEEAHRPNMAALLREVARIRKGAPHA